MIVTLIYATDEDDLLGIDNKMPWHCLDDLKHFKRVTIGHPVIMGRRTAESLERPLPGRANIVLSRHFEEGASVYADSVIRSSSLHDALSHCENIGAPEVFIIGGASVLSCAEPYASRVLHTRIAGSHSQLRGQHIFWSLGRKWVYEKETSIKGGIIYEYRRMQ